MRLGQTLYFSSPNNGEGKTTLIRNIGNSLAELGKKVLIIDLSKNEEDYINFFKFKKYFDLEKVYQKELSLQTIKLIYPENRSLTIIKNYSERIFEKDFFEDFFNKIKKTYDYILIEENIENINNNKYKNKANKKYIILSDSYKEINEENYIINRYRENEQKKIEELLNNKDKNCIGIINETEETEVVKTLSTENPHTKFNSAFKRIGKRIINDSKIEKIEDIKNNSKIILDIFYRKFDIKTKNSF